MSSHPGIDLELAWARDQMRIGATDSAIESLRKVLAADPELAVAHALLASCLITEKRLHAAEHEARMALRLDPMLPDGRLALGTVLLLKRDLKGAAAELEELRRMAPGSDVVYRLLAEVEDLKGNRAEVRRLLDQALALDPEEPETLVELGEWYLDGGDVASARQRAREALTLAPTLPSALVLMGLCLLRDGQVDEARQHAVWALAQRPSDRGALALLASIKARGNWFLGLWWRWSVWMGDLGEGRALLVLFGTYVLYRFGVVALTQQEKPDLAGLLQFAWLGICLYTWVGPGLFRRSLEKDLEKVVLRKGF